MKTTIKLKPLLLGIIALLCSLTEDCFSQSMSTTDSVINVVQKKYPNASQAFKNNEIGAIAFDVNEVDSSLHYLLLAYQEDSSLVSVNYNLAVVYYTTAKYSLALKHIKKEIVLDSNNLHYYLLQADIYDQLDNRAELLRIADKIEQLDGSSSMPFFYRGVVFFRNEQYEKALTEYSTAILKDLTNTYVIDKDLMLRRAATYAMLGKQDKALDDVNVVLSVDPQNEDALTYRFSIYWEKKDTTNMCKCILNYKTIYPLDSVAINKDLKKYDCEARLKTPTH